MATLRTVKEIIEDAVSDGLGQPRSPIQNDVLLEAIARYRKVGKFVFDSFPWDAKKIDQFTTANSTYVTSFTAGVITFTALVDIVRAIKPLTSAGEDTEALWPQSDIEAAIRGVPVESDRFVFLTDGTDGVKRIKVDPDSTTTTYGILAAKRFVPAIVDASYSAGSPSATPTDYRVLTWPIHRAENALVAYLADELRMWDGQAAVGDGGTYMQRAIDTITRQESHAQVHSPAHPLFGESTRWW